MNSKDDYRGFIYHAGPFDVDSSRRGGESAFSQCNASATGESIKELKAEVARVLCVGVEDVVIIDGVLEATKKIGDLTKIYRSDITMSRVVTEEDLEVIGEE